MDMAREHGIAVVMTADRDGSSEHALPAVVVDTSPGPHVGETAAYCVRSGAALVHCASDLDAHGEQVLRALAVERPVVRAVNLSVGHWLQQQLVALLASLTAGFEPVHASVFERHTVTKQDRPSASAKALAATWSREGGGTIEELVSYRSGRAVSEHRVDVTLTDESVAVVHDASSLRAAARGAVVAARWAATAHPGYHTFEDVLSLHLTSGDTAHA